MGGSRGRVPPGPPPRVLDLLGLRSHRITVLKDIPLEIANWLAESAAGERVVLRRYSARTTREDLAYEHQVLGRLAHAGWVVPAPVGQVVSHAGFLYCPTRYVPGAAIADEDISQQRRRGQDLARLHVTMRDLGADLGQRPGWQPQHLDVTTKTGFDWDACLDALMAASPRLGTWASAVLTRSRAELAAIGASELPLTVVHGDFAEWNVHYAQDRLAGVIDFGLTHLDSRPYELAIARTYRAPHTIVAYRDELAALGWPLSDLEEAAIGPVYRLFRVGMVAWEAERARTAGDYDVAALERLLAKTGVRPP